MINIKDLDEILEALLFVSGDGLKIDEIANHLELQKSEINPAIKRLKEKYSDKCGIHLITYNGKIQFATNPDYKDVIAAVLNPIKERELSNAVLETAAIIAYRQPVTRTEIESIRGSNSDYTVQVLLSNNLIEVVGRKDAVGKPLLYGTTDNFLKRFQVENISDLPDYSQLLESIQIIESKNTSVPEEQGFESMYNEFEIPDEEAEVPEFLANEEKLERFDGDANTQAEDLIETQDE